MPEILAVARVFYNIARNSVGILARNAGSYEVKTCLLRFKNGIVNLFAKELANVVFDHLSQIVALVVHGQDNAVQRQLGIKLLFNLIDIANQISNTFQSQKFALQRNDYGISGNQSIYRDKAERGRAVYQNIVIIDSIFGQCIFKSKFTIIHINQFNFRAGQIGRRRNQRKIGNFGPDDSFGQFAIADQNFISRIHTAFFINTHRG